VGKAISSTAGKVADYFKK